MRSFTDASSVVSILGVFLVALFRVGSLHAPFCKKFFVRSTTIAISAGLFERAFCCVLL